MIKRPSTFRGKKESAKGTIDKLIKRGFDFTVISTQSVSTINIGGKSMRFGGIKKYQKYMYLCKLVQDDAKKHAKREGLVAEESTKIPKIPIVNYVSASIKKYQGYKMILTDINKCYMNVAYQLDIISRATYEKLDALPPSQKLMRQISIGSLSTTKHVEVYKGGEKIEEYSKRDNLLKQVHSKILEYVDGVMLDMIKIIGKGCLMWMTDCVYYLPEYKEDVHGYLTSCGFTFKDEDAVLLDYEESTNRIYWKNLKDPTVTKYSYIRNIDLEI